MACYNPWPAWRTTDGELVLFPRQGQDILREQTLPCGKCVGCLLERARQWAIRCMHEAQMHERNCFITLTYNDEHLPPGNNLDYRHWQNFMKYLRKRIRPDTVRFFMAGEYGTELARPHFHACLFGYDFPDKQPIRALATSSTLYRSAILESIWTKGYSSIGEVNEKTASYVARYVLKKQTGDQAKAHYTWIDNHGEIHTRRPEFNGMSRRPGIGSTWLHNYRTDVYPSDQAIVNGRAQKPPRYYDKLLRQLDEIEWDEIRAQREFKRPKGHDTEQRLRAREAVTKAGLTFHQNRKIK